MHMCQNLLTEIFLQSLKPCSDLLAESLAQPFKAGLLLQLWRHGSNAPPGIAAMGKCDDALPKLL